MTSTVHGAFVSATESATKPSIRRGVAGAGVLGAALFVAGTVAGGVPLAPDASPVEVVDRYAGHRGAVLVGVLLASVAGGLLLVFLDGLQRALPSRVRTVTVASWVVLLAIISAGTAPLTALTWRGADAANPGTLNLAFDLANLSTYSLSAVAAFVSVAAPTWALRRAAPLPRWLLLLAGAELVTNAVELAGIGVRSGWNTAGYAAGLGPLLWMAWLIGLAATLGRRGR